MNSSYVFSFVVYLPIFHHQLYAWNHSKRHRFDDQNSQLLYLHLEGWLSTKQIALGQLEFGVPVEIEIEMCILQNEHRYEILICVQIFL